MKKSLIVFNLFCLLSQINAQVSFKASANEIVGLKENFELSFTVNETSTRFLPPDLSEFKILKGPSSSSATNISMINGKTTTEVSNTYTYNLQARKLGVFTIGKASIIVNDIVYYSDPISIKVVDSVMPQKPQKSIKHSGKNDSTFVRMLFNKNTIYQGEQVTTSIKIYTKLNISSVNSITRPMFKGFWVDRFDASPINERVKENVNGIDYGTVTIQQFVLSPLQSGNITIEPCKLDCTIRRQAKGKSVLDPNLESVEKINSPRYTIKVLPLPKNAPASFIDAVGKDFKIETSLSNNSVKCHENLTFKLLISGDGNLKIMGRPKIKIDSSITVLEPKIKYGIRSNLGAVDTIIYEYVITPQKKGVVTIPPITFSYFDIKTKQYKTITSGEIGLNVDQCKNERVEVGLNPEPKKDDVKGDNIILTLDLSSSMLAMDIEPNRLMASKEVAINFIKQNEASRIGLVLFGKNSYSLCPPTNDYTKLTSLVNTIDTGMVKDGTAIGIGLATAINQMKDKAIRHKYIILLTDGVSNEGEIDPITAAQIARLFNIRLYTIGIGAKDSAMYPFKFMNVIQNQIMPSKLDEETLRKMAYMANGKYFRVKSSQDFTKIFNEIYNLEKNKAEDLKYIPLKDKNNQIIPVISKETAIRVLNAIELEENISLEKFNKEKDLKLK
jgi:hypothetical protein